MLQKLGMGEELIGLKEPGNDVKMTVKNLVKVKKELNGPLHLLLCIKCQGQHCI